MRDHGINFDSPCTQSPTSSSRALSPPLAYLPHVNRYHSSDFQAALANLASVHARIVADLLKEVNAGAAEWDTGELVGCQVRDPGKHAAIATGHKFVEPDQAHTSAAKDAEVTEQDVTGTPNTIASEVVAVAASEAQATEQDGGPCPLSSNSNENAGIYCENIKFSETEDTVQDEEAEDDARAGALRRYSTRSTMPGESAAHRRIYLLLDIVPAIVILVNTITLGLSVDLAPTSDVWQVMEYIFMFCYTTEAVIKMLLFGFCNYFVGPDRYWNWFDATCITLSYIEAFIQLVLRDVEMDAAAVGLMKILRLARLGRLVRALKFPMFDELKAMVFGVVAGLRVLLWAILLLVLVVYILGIIGNTLLGDSVEEFDSVSTATMTMFRCFTDGCAAANGTPLHHNLLLEYGIFFMAIYILTFMFITVGLFNLIMAIFVDNVVTGSLKRNLEEIGSSQREIKERMIEEFADRMKVPRSTVADANGNNISHEVSVTRECFNRWLRDDKIKTLLADAHIETATKSELFDVLDVDMGGELGLDELINGMMRMRGPVTKADTVAMRLQVRFITGLIDGIAKDVNKLANEAQRS